MPTTRPPDPTERMAVGAPVGRLRIAAIGLDVPVVEGVEACAARASRPGHEPRHRLPATAGNVVMG